MCQFSIIVPIYNIEEYLPSCIESILSQSFRDFELILVDDGSTDNCLYICKQYKEKDPRIKILHKNNGGLVSARIAGIKEACGDYVICVDGDDWIGENYLLNCYEIIQRYSPDLICAGFVSAFCDGRIHKEELAYSEGLYDKTKIEKDIFPTLIYSDKGEYFPQSIWAKAFKTELYKKHQCEVREQITIGEDFACIIPLIVDCETLYVYPFASQYFYRQNYNSLTKKKKAYNWNGPIMIWHHINSHIDLNSYGFRNQLCCKMVHSLFNVVCSQFYRKESFREIKKDILDHLDNDVYQYVIYNAHFHGLTPIRIACILLKYKMIRIIQIIAIKRGKQK